MKSLYQMEVVQELIGNGFGPFLEGETKHC